MGQKLEKSIGTQEKQHGQKQQKKKNPQNSSIFTNMSMFSNSSKKSSQKLISSQSAIDQFQNCLIQKPIMNSPKKLKNLIDLDILTVQKISTFLNVEDLISLQLCCQNYKKFFSFSSINSKSFVVYTLVNRHMKINYPIKVEKQKKFSDIMERICQDPQHEWIVLFSESVILRKNWMLLQKSINEQEILKSFFGTRLQLPKLFEEKVPNCANTNFQIRAFQLFDEIRDQEFKNINNTGDYYQICFDISNAQINHIDQIYQQTINDQLCPIEIKQVIQSIMQLTHLCKLYQALFNEAIQSVDILDFPLLYSICWEHYSHAVLEVEKNISKEFEYVNQIYGFEDKIVTLTDIVISIWKQIIQNQSISDQIINSFVKLMQKQRKNFVYSEDTSSDQTSEEKSSSSSPKSNQSAILENYCFFPKQILLPRNKEIDQSSLWSCIKAFIDQSCTSDQVQLLGHNNFKLCDELEQIIKKTQDSTDRCSKFLHQQFSQDITKLTSAVEKDFAFIRQIFGDWISEAFIEPEHHRILNEWLVSSVAPLLDLSKQEFQTPTEQQFICQSLILDSKIIDSYEQLSQASFMASQATKSDILSSVIVHIKNPQKQSIIDSEILTQISDISQSSELAKKIRASYPGVATLESYIARRKSALELNTQSRENLIQSRLLFSSNSLVKSEFETIPIENSQSLQETFFNLVRKHSTFQHP